MSATLIHLACNARLPPQMLFIEWSARDTARTGGKTAEEEYKGRNKYDRTVNTRSLVSVQRPAVIFLRLWNLLRFDFRIFHLIAFALNKNFCSAFSLYLMCVGVYKEVSYHTSIISHVKNCHIWTNSFIFIYSLFFILKFIIFSSCKKKLDHHV